MKKMHAILLAAGLSFVVATPVMAQLGGLGGLMGGKGGSSGNVEADVKSFNEKSMVINRLTAVSLVAINAAYSKDEDRANAQAKIDKLNATTDPKEQNALVAEINKSEGAKVAQLSESKDLAEQTKNLDKEKQKQVGMAVQNYLIAGLRAVDLAKTGQGILQGAASNPLALPKLATVKDALPLLGDATTNSAKVLPKFVDVLRGAKVDVPKVSADSKEVAITSI